MEERVEISGLCKQYGRKQALDGIQLSIGPGMFGLLGRNGAGKTTLMRILATLLTKTEGEITVCGIPIRQSREIRQITGYLPQEFAIYPGMTVYEALDYLGVLSGLDRATRKRRIPDLLEQVNLTASRSKKVKTLSGGMNRRLGIAQAILHDPRVLIVDEPTAGLDPEERIRFRNLLADIAQERTVLLSTHIVGDIEATCEQIAILDEGKLLYKGRTQELVETAAGRVYTVTVPRQELETLSQTHLITGRVAQGEFTTVRLIAKLPLPPNAVSSPRSQDAVSSQRSPNTVPSLRLPDVVASPRSQDAISSLPTRNAVSRSLLRDTATPHPPVYGTLSHPPMPSTLSSPPTPDAQPSPPTIEDAYLLAMHCHEVAQAQANGGAHR